MRIPSIAMAFGLFVIAGCDTADAPAASSAADRAAAVSVEDYSVYELPGAWRDQSGAERTLETLGGRVQVVAMVYTECTHTCPAILAEFHRLRAQLEPAPAEGVGFVFVSLDPRRDTPERLAEYAERARLDPGQWTLLTGSADQVAELAALLGVRYRDEPGGEISHANTYFVLDRQGRIAHRQAGLRTGQRRVLEAIRTLAARP